MTFSFYVWCVYILWFLYLCRIMFSYIVMLKERNFNYAGLNYSDLNNLWELSVHWIIKYENLMSHIISHVVFVSKFSDVLKVVLCFFCKLLVKLVSFFLSWERALTALVISVCYYLIASYRYPHCHQFSWSIPLNSLTLCVQV